MKQHLLENSFHTASFFDEENNCKLNDSDTQDLDMEASKVPLDHNVTCQLVSTQESLAEVFPLDVV